MHTYMYPNIHMYIYIYVYIIYRCIYIYIYIHTQQRTSVEHTTDDPLENATEHPL